MIKILIAGAGGRMGMRIAELSKDFKNIKVGGLLERKEFPVPEKEILPRVKLSTEINSLMDSFDVMIDFTTPSSSLQNLKSIRNEKKCAVIGTTGLNAKELNELKEYSNSIPIVYSPNMSAGVNTLFYLVQKTAEMLKDYDAEIVEAHHNRKKDAPSGTALKLAELIAENTGRNLSEDAVYGRSGKTCERKKNEIGIHAVRAGDIVGEHSVYFAGSGECVELAHRAYSRDTFAVGALKAAEWVFGRTPGMYSMMDVLGLK